MEYREKKNKAIANLCLLTPVDEEQPRLENAPQLGPALEGAPDLEPVGEDDDGLVLEGREQLPLHALLLPGVALALGLVGLFPVDRRAGGGTLELEIM